MITDKVHYPISWAEGKVDALLEVTDGKMPFFVSGNTSSDVPLIEISSDIKLVVHGSEPTGLVYNSEIKALNLAKEKNWDYFDYINQKTPEL